MLNVYIYFTVSATGQTAGTTPKAAAPSVTYKEMLEDPSLFPEGSSAYLPNIVPTVFGVSVYQTTFKNEFHDNFTFLTS